MLSTLKRSFSGDFAPGELKRYLVVETVLVWGLVGLARLSYPAAGNFSIMTHSFSSLGSFDACHNPRWWWLMSVAMVLWGGAAVPQVLYLYRRFVAVGRRLARFAAFTMLAGCLGVVGTGLIPTANGYIIGKHLHWGSTHEKMAMAMAGGFGLGIVSLQILLFVDRFRGRRLGKGGYWKFVWPYALWWTVFVVVACVYVKWTFVYADMKAAAEAAGRTIEGSWTEALNTPYSIPLWERVLLGTFYVFWAWLLLVTPNKAPE